MKFQDDISNMNTYIHTYVRTYIHTYGQAETNMPPPPHFFKVGGITKGKHLGLVCIGYGPKWYGPKWSWVEMVMGRNDQ